MTWVLRHRCGRALGAGLLSVALLSGGTAGAFAADSTAPGAGSAPPSPATGMATITIHADKTSVKAGQTVTFSGRTTGLKVGSPLLLQHQKSGKWVPMKATSKVKNGSSYSLTATFNTPGTETLRVASANMAGRAHSPTVTVKVS
ncbi:hypothetical protein [Streptomyces sp. NPDC001851]|uniref:hypothetical protein n=1 Tax=Streptomyces sp. NPDC001851 TaxID=3154529 RepID=UPI0033241AED